MFAESGCWEEGSETKRSEEAREGRKEKGQVVPPTLVSLSSPLLFFSLLSSPLPLSPSRLNTPLLPPSHPQRIQPSTHPPTRPLSLPSSSSPRLHSSFSPSFFSFSLPSKAQRHPPNLDLSLSQPSPSHSKRLLHSPWREQRGKACFLWGVRKGRGKGKKVGERYESNL